MLNQFSKIRALLNRFRPWLLVALFWLCQVGEVWAQADDEEKKEAWVVSYALVILSVGMGLFVICRPGKRSKKVKAE